VDDLREQWSAEVDVVDLNLEEIFVELHSSHEKRPLKVGVA
jgi:hypothetical protein